MKYKKTTKSILNTIWEKGASFIDQATKWFVIIGLLTYLIGLPDAEVNKYWGILYRATNQGGDGGRTNALEKLNCHYKDLSGVNVSRARLLDLNLSNSKAVGANFKGARLEDAKFENANLAMANLQGAGLVNANLRNAMLHETDLTKSNIRGAKFDGACLDGTDFTGAISAETDQFSGAYWTNRTKFPDNIDTTKLVNNKINKCFDEIPGFKQSFQTMEQRMFYGRGFFERYFYCIF